MSNDAGQNENQFRTLGFVGSSEAEQEKQKADISQYCQEKSLILPADNQFFSDWQMLEKELQQGQYIAVVVTDVGVLSKEPNESADRVVTLLEYRIRVEVINRQQYDLLEPYQPQRLTISQLEFIKQRVLNILEQRML